MARVLVKEKAYSDARDYYHRAIYGQWKTDPAGNELLARFELVDRIASQKGRGRPARGTAAARRRSAAG